MRASRRSAAASPHKIKVQGAADQAMVVRRLSFACGTFDMERHHYGIEHVTDEDRAYRGSRFADVQAAIFANPYQRVWGAAGERPLPVHTVTLSDMLRVLPFGRRHLFRQATARGVDSHADLRWGADRMGFRRIVHPNGICLTGRWRITTPTDYSGYFTTGSEALTIGRYSNCCTETQRGRNRSLSMVGKLFPTTDPDHAEPVRTASFFTQQDIGGGSEDFINDIELRNAPNTTAWRRGLGLPILLITGATFARVDRMPSIRQLYEVAELGKPPDAPTRTPSFMRLLVDPEQPRIGGEALDFRDEIMAQIYDRGDPAPKRTLRFLIEVSDQGTTRGPAFYERRSIENWRRIGEIVFDRAVVSYNGDFVIHFNHPTWRDDPNDPSTATRVKERKVRWGARPA